jgi:hypothetical protein
MNTGYSKPEVEKPKGKRAQRKETAAKALKLSYHLDTDASALAHVGMVHSDIVRHLRAAADLLRRMAEL